MGSNLMKVLNLKVWVIILIQAILVTSLPISGRVVRSHMKKKLAFDQRENFKKIALPTAAVGVVLLFVLCLILCVRRMRRGCCGLACLKRTADLEKVAVEDHQADSQLTDSAQGVAVDNAAALSSPQRVRETRGAHEGKQFPRRPSNRHTISTDETKIRSSHYPSRDIEADKRQSLIYKSRRSTHGQSIVTDKNIMDLIEKGIVAEPTHRNSSIRSESRHNIHTHKSKHDSQSVQSKTRTPNKELTDLVEFNQNTKQTRESNSPTSRVQPLQSPTNPKHRIAATEIAENCSATINQCSSNETPVEIDARNPEDIMLEHRIRPTGVHKTTAEKTKRVEELPLTKTEIEVIIDRIIEKFGIFPIDSQTNDNSNNILKLNPVHRGYEEEEQCLAINGDNQEFWTEEDDRQNQVTDESSLTRLSEVIDKILFTKYPSLEKTVRRREQSTQCSTETKETTTDRQQWTNKNIGGNLDQSNKFSKVLVQTKADRSTQWTREDFETKRDKSTQWSRKHFITKIDHSTQCSMENVGTKKHHSKQSSRNRNGTNRSQLSHLSMSEAKRDHKLDKCSGRHLQASSERMTEHSKRFSKHRHGTIESPNLQQSQILHDPDSPMKTETESDDIFNEPIKLGSKNSKLCQNKNTRTPSEGLIEVHNYKPLKQNKGESTSNSSIDCHHKNSNPLSKSSSKIYQTDQIENPREKDNIVQYLNNMSDIDTDKETDKHPATVERIYTYEYYHSDGSPNQ